jgi:hypothetical protein
LQGVKVGASKAQHKPLPRYSPLCPPSRYRWWTCVRQPGRRLRRRLLSPALWLSLPFLLPALAWQSQIPFPYPNPPPHLTGGCGGHIWHSSYMAYK